MAGEIKNWSTWDAQWVSVDVHEVQIIDHDSGNPYRGYQGYLNICLDQDKETDDMKVIIIGTNLFSVNPGWVAFWTYDLAKKTFGNVVRQTFLIGLDGNIVDNADFEKVVEEMFHNPMTVKETN